jgi:NADH-quinone oxidoreductase subunit N
MSILGVGILLIIGGVAFKTAAVPFHFWAPEAYEGAPAPVSAFLSSASKAAGFVLAFRAFAVAFPIDSLLGGPVEAINWVVAFQILAIATMFIGNFAAATQETVKRMMAYSSVGHAGYVLIGLAALSSSGEGLAFSMSAGMAHLLVYGFMNTGAFLFIALAEYWGIGRRFEDYNGLGQQAPLACAAMTVFLFSLAGLPIGGGFFSKFYLLEATVNVGAYSLAFALIVNSALSLFYYSRVVKAMWIEEPTGERSIESYPTGLYTAIIAAAVVTVLLLPGFTAVSDLASQAVALI